MDDETGEIAQHETILSLPSALKIAISPKGDSILVTSEKSETIKLFSHKSQTTEITVPSGTSEARTANGQGFIATNDGEILALRLPDGTKLSSWNAKSGLNPPGRKVEDMLPLGDRLFATIQKDSKKGTGNRLVVLNLPTLALQADLPFPRNHPELEVKDDPKEQGPGPEILLAAPESNTLAITLDLYGTVAFANLDAALRGKWSHLQYVPCSADGRWGTAFPDRAAMFRVGGADYLVIANAGPDAGLALLDVARRKVVQFFPTDAGAETPIFLSKSQKIVTVVSGKRKLRKTGEIEADPRPDRSLLVVDASPLVAAKKATLKRIPFDKPVVRVQAVNPGKSEILLLALGADASELAVYDLAAEKEITREPAKGPVNRIAVWNGKPAP